MLKTNSACSLFAYSWQWPRQPFTSLPVPYCVSETLCQPWKDLHVLPQPNDFSIHDHDSEPWPHDFSSFFSNHLHLCQKPIDVVTPWIQSSNEITPPATFSIVKIFYPQLPTLVSLLPVLSHWVYGLSSVWPPVFVLKIYQLFPTFAYLPKLWESFYQLFKLHCH